MTEKLYTQADLDDAVKLAVYAERERNKWQPLDTAPDDGTEFIAVHSNIYGTYYSIVKFIDGSWVGMCDGEKSIECEGEYFTDYHLPYFTHWMPLPEAPKEQDDE
jgi:hypothetical protein